MSTIRLSILLAMGLFAAACSGQSQADDTTTTSVSASTSSPNLPTPLPAWVITLPGTIPEDSDAEGFTGVLRFSEDCVEVVGSGADSSFTITLVWSADRVFWDENSETLFSDAVPYKDGDSVDVSVAVDYDEALANISTPVGCSEFMSAVSSIRVRSS